MKRNTTFVRSRNRQKSIFQLPRLAQRVAFQGPRPDLLAIAPVVNDFHPLWRHAETDHLLRHVRAYHHIAARAPQGSVAHGAQRACRVAAHEAHAQSLGNLGKQIVQPVHEMCTTQFRHPSRHHRNQWRIGFRNDHVAGSTQTRQPPAGTQVKTQIVESPADEIPTAKARAPHAVHFDAIEPLVHRKSRTGVIDKLTARDYRDIHPCVTQIPGQIRQHLTGC
jgi:hypothetical protein